MNSTSFDSLLILNRNTGATVAADDNSGGGTNSLINFTLPETGVYVIIATPFAPNRTGDYTLTLTRTTSLQPEVLAEETESVETVRATRLNSLSDDSRLERFANRRVVVQ